MRLSRLSLERFGRFEVCELNFRPGIPDLHVIYGENEAGKTTSLAAVSDLLFGFPVRSPYNFLFDYSLLRVGAVLETAMPKTFDGFPFHIDNTIMTCLCCCSIDRLFASYLGTSALPKGNADWVALTEVDLGHVTSGLVVFDGPGELTARREYLAYYPDAVWRKRIADWCMYITGRDAPYNLHRTVKRGDTTTARLYRAAYCKQVMELCFALNRRYSTYTKWLNRSYRALPRFAPAIAAMVDEIMESDDLAQNVQRMIEVNYALGDSIAELGLASPPLRKEFDDALTVLTLYDTAAEIYSTIPADLVRPSFNRTEMWERLVRDALFAPEDCHNKGRSGPPAEHLATAE